MSETIIKDVKLKIGTEAQFQSKLKDLAVGTLVGTTDSIAESDLDTSIVNKLTLASTALQSHQTIATGSANGTIAVAGTDVSVKGLGDLAYKSSLSKSDVGLGNVDNVKQYSSSNPNFGTVTPKMDGTSAVGTATTYSRSDHVHPTDTSRASTAVATTSANGLMSSSDKTKLNGIASGAQVNTITGVKGNSESSYRTGNVNITASNIGLGAVVNTGDSATPTSGGTTKFTTGGAYTLKQSMVDLTSQQTNISGLKGFTGGIRTDDLYSNVGQSMVRSKDTISKVVFGNEQRAAVLMGNTTRPYYSSSGTDFTGVELALKSDITSGGSVSIYKHDVTISLDCQAHRVGSSSGTASPISDVHYTDFSLSSEPYTMSRFPTTVDGYLQIPVVAAADDGGGAGGLMIICMDSDNGFGAIDMGYGGMMYTVNGEYDYIIYMDNLSSISDTVTQLV